MGAPWDVGGRIIAAFEAGSKERRAQQKMEQDKAVRDVQLKGLKLEQDKLKHDQQISDLQIQHGIDMSSATVNQGQPTPSIPPSTVTAQGSPIPATLQDHVTGLAIGQQRPMSESNLSVTGVQNPPIDSPLGPQARQLPFAPTTVPGASIPPTGDFRGINIPPQTVTPQNQQQVMTAQFLNQKLAEAAKTITVPKDAKVVNAATGATIADNPEAPIIIPQGLPGAGTPITKEMIPLIDTAANLVETRIRDANNKGDKEEARKLDVQRLGIQSLRAQVEAKKFMMEFGGDAIKGWTETLKQNPDAAASVPPALRTSVQQQFTHDTGLPFPKPLAGTAVDQERAARNALDGISFIEDALKNPEIQKQIGPIMGRLGNAEQAVGTATGLSPQAAQLAQELRTRMQYFVFQEGKAVLGGRLPQQLMDQLSQSSANVKMDANMLRGALNGAKTNALSVLDNSDKQRFGGQMRPRGQRGIPSTAAAPEYKIGDTVDYQGKPHKILDIKDGKLVLDANP